MRRTPLYSQPLLGIKLPRMKRRSLGYKDPRWQRLRLRILERDDWQCCRCGDFRSTLNVHHRRYGVSGEQPWNVQEWDLETLCRRCHATHHNKAA